MRGIKPRLQNISYHREHRGASRYTEKTKQIKHVFNHFLVFLGLSKNMDESSSDTGNQYPVTKSVPKGYQLLDI